MLNYRKPAIWVIAVAAVLILLTVVFFLTDPIVLDIADYNWRFSHVKVGEEYLYVAPEREHLYGITNYADYFVSVDGNTLYLGSNGSRDYFSLKLNVEDATPYTTLYSFNHDDTAGYVLLADIKSDADMSGGMVIVGSGDVVFGVPTNEPTLVVSIDGGEIYFYHDPNAEKYDPFAETQPVEIIEIASHISEEKLSFGELRSQKDEIWEYHNKIMEKETDPVLRKWASKLAIAQVEGNMNYILFEVIDYTDEDIKRFEERFSHCSYVIRQIG
nr:hypothetical protein [Clostridia bacterium]